MCASRNGSSPPAGCHGIDQDAYAGKHARRRHAVSATREGPSAFLAAIARMYYLDDLGQQEIARVLGVSRSTVSRLLSSAREQGIVRISVDDYDPRDRALEARLQERFQLREAIVVKTLQPDIEHIRQTIGYFAAPLVAERFSADATLGVAGGRTLGALVHYVQPSERVRNITVVQLMGNIGPNASSIDALELSRLLAQRCDGPFYTINAPALVQGAHTRDLLLAHEHIQAVWHLFASLQLALVGIGSLDDSAFVERHVLSPTDVARLREAGAVGEICGRFFDADGQECATDFRDRVISIGLDALRCCPDVIAVTNGASRAGATRAALRGGLISSLVVDTTGATALLAPGENGTAGGR